MKTFFLIIIAAMIFSCSSKKTTSETRKVISDTTMTNDALLMSDTEAPACIKKLIIQFQQEEKQNPPRSIYRYLYNGKTVYFVPAICCDFYSDLYDSGCNMIGHPDGGFTGRGDGTATDFIKTRTGEKLIWKDERK